MRDEVKAVALDQLATGGPQALSINAIGKALGVSGPALYRYFDSRDALLTELILDAYADLTEALRGDPDLTGQYRRWAVAQPHRYRLLFAAPLPGYDAHDPRLVDAAQGAMTILLTRLADDRKTPATDRTTPATGAARVDPVLAGELTRWAGSRSEGETDPGVALTAVTLWSRIHGLVSLEIEGNFASMGINPDPLYAALLTDGR
jgi:AcrR family transcriptional regulator